jgi:hypothetical protein
MRSDANISIQACTHEPRERHTRPWGCVYSGISKKLKHRTLRVHLFKRIVPALAPEGVCGVETATAAVATAPGCIYAS